MFSQDINMEQTLINLQEALYPGPEHGGSGVYPVAILGTMHCTALQSMQCSSPETFY